MAVIIKIISVFFFRIGFANAIAADSSFQQINKVGKVRLNMVGRALQEYDEVVIICETEGLALQSCTSLTTACIDCIDGLIIPIESTSCSMSKEVEGFCESMQKCTSICQLKDCQDELQAAKACMLTEGGCDVDRCSPGFTGGGISRIQGG
ncbi:hypothetical protein ACHAW5_006658 [Stephanodiscus triporus]|uniref:Uncharacterized protein n=1 Tax=Stephanodiscus triporus TaxID=2934178 RepID=A0ABD3N587_9STRA